MFRHITERHPIQADFLSDSQLIIPTQKANIGYIFALKEFWALRDNHYSITINIPQRPQLTENTPGLAIPR